MDAFSINRVILCGRVGKYAPELKRTTGRNPTSFARFSMATHEKFQGGSSKTTWHQISAWGPKLSEFCEKYVRPGMTLIVAGKLTSRSWRTDAGEKRTIVEIRADDIIFVCPEDSKKRKQKEEPKEEDRQEQGRDPGYEDGMF